MPTQGTPEPGKKKAPRPPRVWLNDVLAKKKLKRSTYTETQIKQPKAMNAPIPKWLQGVQ